MQKIIILLLAILPSFVLAQSEIYCGAVMPQNSTSITNNNVAQARELITISVFFHVVWKEEEQNISYEQILSQMDVLNADFRAQNDQSNVAVGFQDDIADTEIEFCLAQRLPNGQATSGIIRTQTNESIIGLKQALYTTSPAVDSEHYLNIWVADLGGGLNGMASFPGTETADKDGVVIDPNYVGTEGLAAESQPYHLGRTLTHEIGHYLNLIHTFGPTTGGTCTADDGVEDTPNSENTYLGECPTGIEFSCESSDMWMNFMTFADDECMSMFSQGQKTRMLATLAGERSGLTDSEGCLPVHTNELENVDFSFDIYPNPTQDFCIIERAVLNQNSFSVSLFSTEGKLIFHQESKEDTLYLSFENLASGVYFVLIAEGEKRSWQKVVYEER